MKLLRILETKIVENANFKGVIKEVSEKVKKQLLTKFSTETQDSPETIFKLVDAFEQIKSGLPADKRDILKYSYQELKDVITSKAQAKEEDALFTMFKKKESKIDRNELKKYVRRYLDIKSQLPNKLKNLETIDFLTFVDAINTNYPKLVRKILSEKFKLANPQITPEILNYYLNAYLTNLDMFPNQGKRVSEMSFTEFEHLVDGVVGEQEGQGQKSTGEDEFNKVDIIYDENNLKVFAPKTKDQCMKLRNGRTWCTSREGSSNLYYNYRLDNERTLYYVIDEDKPFKDLDFAVVILVDPYGGTALADGSNSGRYSGHSNIPWDEIENKIPKLKGLKSIFKPVPLTNEEKQQIAKVRNARVGDNPMESFENPQEVELWLEIRTPTLSDIQYSNLTADLKKKYIALGMSLSSDMMNNSEPEVLSYYINKKIETIKNTTLRNLDDDDIALLNLPAMRKIKEELKPKFASSIGNTSGKEIEIEYPSGESSKFIALYGLDSLFEGLPIDMTLFAFRAKTKNSVIINIPRSISKYKELDTLILENCIESLPEEVCQLSKLSFLTLNNNDKLTKVPECIGNMESLAFVSFKGCDNLQIPKAIVDRAEYFGDNMYNFF